MNAGKYKLREFLTHQNMEQIVVPEIQRDYVWKPDNVTRLLDSINEDASAQPPFDVAELDGLSPALREITLRGIEEKKVYTNIGFIYAYHDPDYLNKYFLIDGQQRLTTMFLVLLALAKGKNQSAFRRSYFPQGVPKIDYKVREASHHFLLRFVGAILDGMTMDEVRNSFWYFTEYECDITVQSLLANYSTILQFTSSGACAFDFGYIENNVEFWYFDTSKSQQGEELYIYMNSRGENVQPNEQIKASLLECYSEEDKLRWGTEWEEWQDYFWKNRGGNSSADAGFDQFLRWIAIINYVTRNSDATVRDNAQYIQRIWPLGDIDKKYLSLEDIDAYFKSLRRLGDGHPPLIKAEWLRGEGDMADLIRLLPILMFAKENGTVDGETVFRFARFFRNIPRLDHVRRSPDDFCANAVRLTHRFLSEGHADVVGLVNYATGDFRGILTEEEVYKLRLAASCPDNAARKDLEAELWRAEDYLLLNGQIDFLFYCMDVSLQEQDVSLFSFDTFRKVSSTLRGLFGEPFSPDDLLRRALLTKGNYSIHEGSTPKLEGQRWTLGNLVDDWRAVVRDRNRRSIVRDLLLGSIDMCADSCGRETRLRKAIDDYGAGSDRETSWMSAFIKHPEVLQYCRRKNFCKVSDSLDSVYLLEGTRATDGSYMSLAEFLTSRHCETSMIVVRDDKSSSTSAGL